MTIEIMIDNTYQKSLSLYLSRSVVTRVTSVLTVIPFCGISFVSSSSWLTPSLPPRTETPCPRGLKSSVSSSWLKSLLLCVTPLPQIRFADEVALELLRVVGACEKPWPRVLKRGRRLGMLAQTTAIFGSRADHMPESILLPVFC